MRGGDGEIAPIIVAQRIPTLLALHEIEGREVRQLMTFEKDQRGFQAAVGEKQAVGKLRQVGAILGHLAILDLSGAAQ